MATEWLTYTFIKKTAGGKEKDKTSFESYWFNLYNTCCGLFYSQFCYSKKDQATIR